MSNLFDELMASIDSLTDEQAASLVCHFSSQVCMHSCCRRLFLHLYKCKEIDHITDVIDKNEPINFSLLARLTSISHSTGVWEKNGDELVRSGTAGIRELAAYREDIWDTVIENLSPNVLSGTGLPLRIMEEVQFGRYQRNGLPDDIKQLLQKLEIEDWHIEHISKIYYLFPKSVNGKSIVPVNRLPPVR